MGLMIIHSPISPIICINTFILSHSGTGNHYSICSL